MLSEKVKETRLRMGLSQRDLSSRAKVSLATVQNFELGKANPSLQTLEAILEVLNLALSIHPREIDWKSLAAAGVPLLTLEDEIRIVPHRSFLVETLHKVSSQLAQIREGSREHIAFVSFCVAIREHYPYVWQELDWGLRSYVEASGKFVSIKLRRLALSRMCKYL